MDPVELYEELSRDLGFGAEEAALLRRAQPLVEPHAPEIVDRFYEVLSANPTQRAVFDDDAQIERQKVHLRAWIVSLFDGEYDAAYVQRRARIGRAHVRIRLPQRYMVSMMNLLRRNLRLAFDDEAPQAGWSAEEIRRLWCALDQLLDIELAVMLETFRDDYDARLRTSERLASLGKLAASIGHELRNPLAVIDSSTHLLARRCDDDPKTTKHIDRIREQVARSNHIITDLLELARDRPPVREPVELGELVHLALAGLPRTDKSLRTNVSEGLVVVDGSQLRQVIFNLVQNALQAARSWVQLDAVVSEERLRVVVTDDGPGFTLEAKANLFEPLYTTKVNGVGLGLWLSKRIVEKHDGVIQAQSLPEGGARFELDIPTE
ncbi:MAG: histidine kinase [Sandaracinus sp.]|nr:histidine kinase [Sandaracinus sp.]MCB9633520.1 histidine kinase [Sandaracinus sp.]